MNTLQTILSLIFLPSSIVAGIVFILRKFFEQTLSRDIVKYKANLRVEFEHSKLRLESQLQTRYFEFQTKFSSYHQKQTEVIGELYGMLNETEWAVELLVRPEQPGGGRSIPERVVETDGKCVELSRYFSKHRIYLDDGACKKMDKVVAGFRTAVIKFKVSNMNISGSPSVDMLLEALKVIEEELPPLKEALESQFRQSLSIVPDAPPNKSLQVSRG